MTDHSRRPGVGLRPYREQSGMTQAQVAQEVSRLAWYRHRQHVGVNADMVSKWERRTKAVSGFYQELLCELFGATPEQLGFRPPAARPTADDEDTGAGGVAAILAQLGGAASLLGPAVLDAWKVEHVKRRTLLKLMGTVPVALTTLATGQSTAATARQLDTLADGYQTLYHSSAPIDLMAPVAAHLRTVAAFLKQSPGPLERRQMLRNRSRVATLAGRISFFDLDDPMSARSYYQVAVEAAHEVVADPSMAGKVIGEPEMLGVQSLTADQLTLRMTLKTRPNAQWSVQRKLRREILRAYDENGIDLPYPQGRIHAVVGGRPAE